MARPLRIEYPGAFYHVTARGNDRKAVFKGRRDREKFFDYLESATERYGAVIHAYCLMDNHYHLLIQTPLGNLSKIMQHINGGYTMYFNTKRKRVGHLFQGRYKAILVNADEYAKELSIYIHLNPVRAGIEKVPDEYEWSSCRYYTKIHEAPGWLQREFILNYFSKTESTAMEKYRGFVWSAMEVEYNNPLSERQHSVILGNHNFIEEIKTSFMKNRRPDRELPALRKTLVKKGLEEIEQAVDRTFAADEKLARQVKLYFSHRYSGLKLKDIGYRYGISESGVTQASRRIRNRIETDEEFERIIHEVAKFVNV